MSEQGDHHGERREYAGLLTRATLPEDPLELFGAWLGAALDAGAKDATAMALATASVDGVPAVRIVLLKSHGPEGFIWFTDYLSQKGRELAANPQASLAFYWRDFDRQVRVTGTVGRVSAEESQAYFNSRPEESRFSAAASEQSQPVADRATLEARVAELRALHPDGDVPRPESWGGFVLAPESIEFWQGREGRLHDRFRYDRTTAGWEINRLQP
ncbi:MAG: pyridoxamine 5'-phosphate oxidase [Pseudomonadota bacterium]